MCGQADVARLDPRWSERPRGSRARAAPRPRNLDDRERSKGGEGDSCGRYPRRHRLLPRARPARLGEESRGHHGASAAPGRGLQTTRPNFRVAVLLKYRSNAHDAVEGTYADDPGPIGLLRKLLGGREGRSPHTGPEVCYIIYRREGEEAEMSASPVIPSPATAGTGAASHGRVSDLLRGHELAGRSPMAR